VAISCRDGGGVSQFEFVRDGVGGVWHWWRRSSSCDADEEEEGYSRHDVHCGARVMSVGRVGGCGTDDDGSGDISSGAGKCATSVRRWDMQRWLRELGRP
jgi:hypothetical protein